MVIWPDNDTQGLKAAIAIKKILPDAIILPQPKRKPKKYDIADAKAEGMDIEELIDELLEDKQRNKELVMNIENLPVIPLGFNSTSHFFLKKVNRTQIKIPNGNWNTSRCLELASLAFWESRGFLKKQGNPDIIKIQDILVRASEAQGVFDPEIIRYTGAWKIGIVLYLNTGQYVHKHNAETYKINESSILTNNKVHFLTGKKFSSMSDNEASKEVGKNLYELARAQQFSSEFAPVALLGWCAIAPFCGILDWRPHIWITGRRGSGKSWLISEYISKLCGHFKHSSSAKDTEAGIRESINSTSMPVIIDEMDARTIRDAEKMQSILFLLHGSNQR